MLNNNHVVAVVAEGSNHSGGIESLLDVQVRGRLVKHVDVYLLHAGETDNEALELTT